MTLKLEIKNMKDAEAIRLITMIVKTLGKCDKWKHDDNNYKIDFNRDEEKETEDTSTVN